MRWGIFLKAQLKRKGNKLSWIFDYYLIIVVTVTIISS